MGRVNHPGGCRGDEDRKTQVVGKKEDKRWFFGLSRWRKELYVSLTFLSNKRNWVNLGGRGGRMEWERLLR